MVSTQRNPYAKAKHGLTPLGQGFCFCAAASTADDDNMSSLITTRFVALPWPRRATASHGNSGSKRPHHPQPCKNGANVPFCSAGHSSLSRRHYY